MDKSSKKIYVKSAGNTCLGCVLKIVYEDDIQLEIKSVLGRMKDEYIPKFILQGAFARPQAKVVEVQQMGYYSGCNATKQLVVW